MNSINGKNKIGVRISGSLLHLNSLCCNSFANNSGVRISGSLLPFISLCCYNYSVACKQLGSAKFKFLISFYFNMLSYIIIMLLTKWESEFRGPYFISFHYAVIISLSQAK